ARIKAVRLCFINSCVPSIVAIDMQPIADCGNPAASPAARMTRATSFIQFVADGCGLRTTVSRAFMEMSILKMAVEVGFVEGMMAATTPRGEATSTIESVWRMMPTVRMGRMKL